MYGEATINKKHVIDNIKEEYLILKFILIDWSFPLIIILCDLASNIAFLLS